MCQFPVWFLVVNKVWLTLEIMLFRPPSCTIISQLGPANRQNMYDE